MTPTPFSPLAMLRGLPQRPFSLELGAVSWFVKLLRRCLAATGCYEPGKRAELLDPATVVSDLYDKPLAALVAKYQAWIGLASDGVCGPLTWAHIAGSGFTWAEPAARFSVVLEKDQPEFKQQTLRAEMLRLARQELGVHEQGGNNRGAEVERMIRAAGGQAGEPWCADFCDAVLRWACEGLGLEVPWHIGRSTGDLVRRARADGRVVAPGDEQPADLWVWTPKGVPHHVGIIEVLLPHTGHPPTVPVPTTCQTIEGNTSAPAGGVNADGDGVFRKVRSLDRSQCVVVRCV